MATRTISAAGGNWNAAGTWDEGVAPIAGDAVVARGGGDSGQVTINVASSCASIVLTNYANTLTYTNTLTTTSTVTYPAGMTVAGTADHITVTSSTFTIQCASGLTGGLRLGGTSQTYTLGAATTMVGTITLNGTTGTTFSGNFLLTAGAMSVTATIMALVMSGDITITGDAALSSATSTTITGGKAFQAATCTVSGGQTVTITGIGSMTITGLTTSSTINVFTGGTWNTGGLTTTGATTGTCVFNVTGGTVTLTSALSCSMTFAGDITWASQTNLYAASGTPTLTYASGTITVGTSTLSLASSCTIVGALPLYNLTLTAAMTLTSNTDVPTIANAFTGPDAAVTFAGNKGLTIATFTNTLITAARTYTFTAGNVYTVTTALSPVTPSAAAGTIRYLTLTAGSSTTFTLGPGATQSVGFVSPTNLDSSAGQTIFTYSGTVTTCKNWISAYPVNAALVDPQIMVGV